MQNLRVLESFENQRFSNRLRNLRFLKRKDKKHLLELLKKQFNFEEKLNYIFLINNKNKVFIINKELANIELNKIKINSIGLYIAELRHNEVRLSIEGSQLIGPKAKKNIIEINEKQARDWLKGKDIETKEAIKGFTIIKHKEDFLGCGKIKDNQILNFVPKTRRLNVSD